MSKDSPDSRIELAARLKVREVLQDLIWLENFDLRYPFEPLMDDDEESGDEDSPADAFEILLIEKAKRDAKEMLYVGKYIQSITMSGEPISYRMADFVAQVLAGMIPLPKHRGRPRDIRTSARDLLVQRAIEAAVATGLNATRNPASEKSVCATFVVKDELEARGIYLAEKTIAEIWRKGRAASVPGK